MVEVINFSDIEDMQLKEIDYAVDGMIVPGLTIFAAPHKSGKSFMMLDLAVAVAQGQQFLGMDTRKKGVLYLALEDNANRIKKRAEQLRMDYTDNLNLLFGVHRIGEGFFDDMDDILRTIPQTQVVIVDTLQMIRSVDNTNSGYAEDYKEMRQLKEYADKKGLCLVVVHHTRKQPDRSDPFNTILGSGGITGVVDSSIILAKAKREEKEADLIITGRDVEYQDLKVVFDNGKWLPIGTAEEILAQKRKEDYLKSPIVATIKACVANTDGQKWMGKAADIINASVNTDHLIDMTAQQVGLALDKLYPLLLEYDGISHNYKSDGNAGKWHIFEQI